MDKKNELILGLDISTKTIGIALFEDIDGNGKLKLLHHVSPKIKPQPKDKLQELFEKARMFEEEFLNKYIDVGITKVIIEEPLLRSNNVNTVATLLRFIWEKVADLEPQITWLYTKTKTLKKENFDMTDAYACCVGYMNMKGLWTL